MHAYGGLVLHDVINMRHAAKAIEAGVDGLVAVSAGAGGHAGLNSPFAFVSEVRRIFDGIIALAGAITTGRHVAAAIAAGADVAYMGTRFIATRGGRRARRLQGNDPRTAHHRHRLHAGGLAACTATSCARASCGRGSIPTVRRRP